VKSGPSSGSENLMDIDSVLKQLADPKQRVNMRQLYALSSFTERELEAFRRWWPGVEPERRLSILQQLVELTETSFEVNFDPIFLLALGDEAGEVREAAIDGLWESSDPELVAPFLFLLTEDPEERVRSAAAAALGRFVYQGELEAIERTLRDRIESALLQVIGNDDESIDVRRRAVEAISFSGRPGIREIITDAYESEDDRMQMSALFAMGRSADTFWRDIVTEELENPNPEIRYEAAKASGELELQDAVPQLGEMAVDSSDREVQEAAVWALGNIGDKEARRVLEACYEGEDEVLSQFAADALDEMDWLGDGHFMPLFSDDELDIDWEDDDEAE
jgi:HEAT repeat protein